MNDSTHCWINDQLSHLTERTKVKVDDHTQDAWPPARLTRPYVPAGPTIVISWPSAESPSECRSSSVFQAITIPPVRSR